MSSLLPWCKEAIPLGSSYIQKLSIYRSVKDFPKYAETVRNSASDRHIS
jgi:hypothetical protein